jgi:ribonuclease BN (tRNA processing enzyme)
MGTASARSRAGEWTATEVARLAAEAEVTQLVLTGFFPENDDPEPLRAEVAAHFGEVRVVEDGDRISIPRPRKPGAS